MGTKMHRAVIYIKDLNSDNSINDIKNELENMRNLEFVTVTDIRSTDIGEWNDDHELNLTDATQEQYESYFPELSNMSTSSLQEKIKEERELRLKAEETVNKMQYQLEQLESKLKKYQELECLVKKL
jgi:UTP:GlnB (protein PII) uridylyltransferase